MNTIKCHRFCMLTGLLAIFCMAGATAKAAAENSQVTVYRCVDKQSKISLQDIPCVNATSQETLNMARPKDAPPEMAKTAKPATETAPVPLTQISVQTVPPPELYRCTDFDGKLRDAEYYDPKPRCVPLWALGYRTRSNSCRWVEDSCVRYEGPVLCKRWEEKARQAELDVSHASSSDAPFLKSELARFTQIVRTSCR